MSEELRIPVEDLRRAARLLLDHVEAVEGSVIDLADSMFWAIPAAVRHNVYEQPTDLTIGQLGDSLESLRSVTDAEEDALGYGLVWLADILRAIGERAVG